MSWNGRPIAGVSAGNDLWLSPRLLVGGGVRSDQVLLDIAQLGGQGGGDSPSVSLHAHYRGDGWHLTGMLGAGYTRLQLQRPIELGAAGQYMVRSERVFEHASAHARLARDLPLGEGNLAPFLALDYGLARGQAFAEQGDTGLELIAGPSRQADFSGSLGARYSREWDFSRHWLRLNLEARYRRNLRDNESLSAAFRGVPDIRFDLPQQAQAGFGELRMGMVGAFGTRSSWSLDYARNVDGDRRGEGWMLTLQQGY